MWYRGVFDGFYLWQFRGGEDIVNLWWYRGSGLWTEDTVEKLWLWWFPQRLYGYTRLRPRAGRPTWRLRSTVRPPPPHPRGWGRPAVLGRQVWWRMRMGRRSPVSSAATSPVANIMDSTHVKVSIRSCHHLPMLFTMSLLMHNDQHWTTLHIIRNTGHWMLTTTATTTGGL